MTLARKSLISHHLYNVIIDVIIIGNCIAMIIRIIEPNSLEESAHGFAACWDTLLFGGRK